MQADTLSLLEALIRCRPVSSDVNAVNRAMRLIQEFLQARQVPCVMEESDSRLVLYASTHPGKQQALLLNAHVDVVPAEGELFEPRLEDGRLYARGASDDLGNVVCMVELLCRQLGKASIGAIFSADEEIGGASTAAMIQKGYGASRMAIVLDGPSCRVANAQKGIMILRLTARGKGGHAAAPWEHDNPIDKLMDGYLRFRAQWKQPSAEQQWQNSMAACKIEAGYADNQIPDEASMTINFRFLEQDDPEKIIAQLKELSGLEVEGGRHCSPMFSDENSPELQKLLGLIHQYYPQQPAEFLKMNGATDARHMQSLGVPIAISSVLGEGAHSKVEWLELESIDKYIRIIEELLADW